MKQCISTIACGLITLFCFLPSLQAQQITTPTTPLTAVQTVTDATGSTTTTTETIQTGQFFDDVIHQLGLNEDQRDVKIRIQTDDVHQTTLASSDQEETVFYFRAAKSEKAQAHENLEKLQITLDKVLAQTIDDKKPLLGVYTENKAEHVEITGLVYEGGAQKAGLTKGDLLVAIESNEINSVADLRSAIAKYKVGDVVQVKYLRNGQLNSVNVTLGEAKAMNYQRRHQAYAYHYDYNDDYYYNSHQDRNPCDVFIGIYTSSNRRGLKVHNIIANTPAENSAIKRGDIVVAYNYVPVDSHRELVSERDKSQAGDYFTVTVLRDGKEQNIEMQYEYCPEEEVQELPELIEAPVENITNTLEISDFSAFPNPTYGPVTVKFKGDAKPTTVRIIDAAGKTVYEEEIINFDGFYNKDIQLKRAVPGNLILTITQDQKVYSENMVFMPRA